MRQLRIRATTNQKTWQRAREGYFVRNLERNLVYCPAGEVLKQKSVKKNEWKEIDFAHVPRI